MPVVITNRQVTELNPSADAPAVSAFTITPSDSATLAQAARALYVGVGGNVTAILEGDTTSVLFSNVPNGSILPVRVGQVLATGTTATGIVGLL